MRVKGPAHKITPRGVVDVLPVQRPREAAFRQTQGEPSVIPSATDEMHIEMPHSREVPVVLVKCQLGEGDMTRYAR